MNRGRPTLDLDRPCTRCGRTPPDVSFGAKSNGHRRSHCRNCANIGNSMSKTYHRYGVRPSETQVILYNQDGKCGICGESTINLCIDHDHRTGKVRGLLCTNCNVGLGHFRDDPLRLVAAIEWLRRS